ncbi:BRCA1 associated protein [Capsaspora owczarzaki ATCC 30864]|uniref:BRCA1 associated protein n=1 Tax=Capsaspora owczarzaki (strain ATCC 30864) TaxID=595528 RepID=A0A0D2U387_CAPO3|nr:BRCA1 associated protein [Capsaspora owczarzaki ATCC 30864]KJE89621.1 BRCA1 associated protein [Capsaspora owczarzaki ATCC 30864]|eukprot:XP_004365927.2 BRCA1 associated protein [Capsaspora owczarzaki ATCC 30864]
MLTLIMQVDEDAPLPASLEHDAGPPHASSAEATHHTASSDAPSAAGTTPTAPTQSTDGLAEAQPRRCRDLRQSTPLQIETLDRSDQLNSSESQRRQQKDSEAEDKLTSASSGGTAPAESAAAVDALDRDAGNTCSIPFYSGNPLVELTKGVLHIFCDMRHNGEYEAAVPVAPASKSNHNNEKGAAPTPRTTATLPPPPPDHNHGYNVFDEEASARAAAGAGSATASLVFGSLSTSFAIGGTAAAALPPPRLPLHRSKVVVILAVPTSKPYTDLIQFTGSVQHTVEAMKIIRDAAPNRYLAVLRFQTQNAADEFYLSFNNRKFNSLEPEVCHLAFVSHIKATHRTDMEALMFEMEHRVRTTTTTTTTTAAAIATTAASSGAVPDAFHSTMLGETSNGATSSSLHAAGAIKMASALSPSAPITQHSPSETLSSTSGSAPGPLESTTSAAATAAPTGTGVAAQPQPQPQDGPSDQLPHHNLVELPTCPVCLERLDESASGIFTTICNHNFHCTCLSRWGDSSCPICRHSIRPDSSNQCFECDCTSSLWICLICGHIGCGRYVDGHAYEHFRETQHTYAMELESQRVWDYAGDNYVHRLIQNRTDGKMVEFSSPGRPSRSERSGAGRTSSEVRSASAAAFEKGRSGHVSAADDPDDLGKKKPGARGNVMHFGDMPVPASARRLGFGTSGDAEAQAQDDGAHAGYEDEHVFYEYSSSEEKVDALQLEYTYLLAAQLERQRAYFEGKMQELEQHAIERERQLIVRMEALQSSTSEMEHKLAASERERKALEKKTLQAREKSSRLQLDFDNEKEITTSLQENQKFWQNELEALKRKTADALKSKEEQIADLGEQVRDLMFYMDTQQKVSASPHSKELQEGQVIVTEAAASSPAAKGKGRKR